MTDATAGARIPAPTQLWERLLRILALLLVTALLLPWVRSPWFDLGGRWLYILVLAMAEAYVLTPLVRAIAWRTEILDVPAARKVHATPTPLLGGLAIHAAFCTALLANFVLDLETVAILVGGSLLVGVGILDDRYGVPAAAKLAAQLGATAMVMGAGVTLSLFPGRHLGLAANIVLTAVWIVGITNAMNFFDGMDGLATGLAILTAGFMGIVAFQTQQPSLGWLCIALVGACLGFLPYNLRPARPASIFLGDTGSPFLGFTLAALAVKGEWAESNFIDVAAPVLIFWIFVFDMVHITVARIATGKVHTFRQWIDYVGRDHLHHRLAALMGSQRLALLLIVLLSSVMGLAAIALKNARLLDAVALLIQAVLVVVVVTVLEFQGNRRAREIREKDGGA
jgi:UDP-GlcNAc:undecaprenyl-phosphate GlcNAc-1-phosphate transferase